MSPSPRPLACPAQDWARHAGGADAPSAHPITTNNRITFALHLDDDDVGIAKRVEFEAPNAALALDIAEGEAEGRVIILYEGARPICRLLKSAAGAAPLWIILSAADAGRPVDASVALGDSLSSAAQEVVHSPSTAG